MIPSSNDYTNTNTTLSSFKINGGVGLTLLINSLISLLLVVVFATCLQPRLSLFNTKKKSHLYRKILEKDNVNDVETGASKDDTRRLYRDDEDTFDQLLPLSSVNDTESNESYWKRMKIYCWECFRFRTQFLLYCIKTLLFPSYRSRDRIYMSKKFGRDMGTYLFFEQQMIYAMIVCAFIGFSILLPVHITGTVPQVLGSSTNDQADVLSGYNRTKIDTPLLITSINMRITEPDILCIHVILSVVFVFVFIYFMVWQFLFEPLIHRIRVFDTNVNEEQNLLDSSHHSKALWFTKLQEANYARPVRFHMNLVGLSLARNEFNDGQPTRQSLSSPYAVYIYKVPSYMTQQSFVHVITAALLNMPDGARLASKIAKIVAIPNVKKRLDMEDKMIHYRLKLEQVKSMKESQREYNPTVTLCCQRDAYGENDGTTWKLRKKIDAVKYYSKHIELLEHDIKHWNSGYMRSFVKGESKYSEPLPIEDDVKSKYLHATKCSGCGFVIFQTTEAANAFVQYYEAIGIGLTQKTIKKGVDNHWTSKIKSQRKLDKEQMQREEQLSDIDLNAPNVIDSDSQTIIVDFRKESKRCLKESDHMNQLTFPTMGVKRVNFEPEDVDWLALFSKHKLNKYPSAIKKFSIYLTILVLFVLFSSPLIALSGAQTLIGLDLINISKSWFERLTGTLGTIFFQYLPTLFVLACTGLLPMLIIKLTMLTPHMTYSVVQREVMKRTYVYLILSTLILPSLLLTSIQGVTSYLNDKLPIKQVFSQLFLPASGSFFINLILQKALLKNTLDLYRMEDLIVYLWTTRFTSPIWDLFGKRRYLTPVQRLKAAEATALYVEYEYSYMHWITSIALAYSMFSPIVLLCGLLYFIYKYYVDRYIILDTYSHRRENSLSGAAFGLKSDYIAQHRMAESNMVLVLGNLFIFSFFQAAFYGSKVPTDSRFIVHTSVTGLMSFSLLILIPATRYVMKRIRRTQIELSTRPNDVEQQISSSIAKRWYEPCTTYDFIPPIPQPCSSA